MEKMKPGTGPMVPLRSRASFQAHILVWTCIRIHFARFYFEKKFCQGVKTQG